MKAITRFTGIALISLIGLFVLISSFSLKVYEETTAGVQEISFGVMPGDSLPADVTEVIKSSCINCHAPGGKALAMSKLNFASWDEYNNEKKIKRADKMCEELSKGSMPPKSFLKKHPELTPTAEQIEIICNWARELETPTPYDSSRMIR